MYDANFRLLHIPFWHSANRSKDAFSVLKMLNKLQKTFKMMAIQNTKSLYFKDMHLLLP